MNKKITLLILSELKKLIAYLNSPIGIRSVGNLESLPSVLICLKPFAKPYTTFDRPVCLRYVIAQRVRAKKSSGIATGTPVEFQSVEA